MKKAILSHFQSTDNLLLPGLLYEPEVKSKQVAIYLHGCGSSSVFYKPEINFYGEMFTSAHISFFPFNNRGAHLIKSLRRISNDEHNDDERVLGGTYYEVIKDVIHDIDGAIDFLKTKGYETFYLIGHSTGANKIAVYHYYKKDNPISKYILLAGGDDTGLSFEMLGRNRFYKALNRSLEEIKKGNNEKQSAKYIFPEPYSYQSLYDLLNPDGDYNTFPFYEFLNKVTLSSKPLFREYHSINKPMLVVYGELDEFCFGNVDGCVDALKKHTSHLKSTTFQIIPQTGHGFDGKEVMLSKIMVDWLK